MTTAQEKINEFLKDRLCKSHSEYGFVVVGDVPINAVETVYQKFGIDISGFKYIMDSICVTHIIDKRHGVNTNDRTPLQVNELLFIPLILSEFDSVEAGGFGPNQTRRLIFKKQITSEYYYVTIQEVRRGRKSLACISLRKRKTR